MSGHLRGYICSMQKSCRVENETNMQEKLSDVRKNMEIVRTENVRQGQSLQNVLNVLKCTFIIQIKRKWGKKWFHQAAKSS